MVSNAILTKKKELTERLYYQEDLEAAKKLILSHLRFVIHVARGVGLWFTASKI